MAVVVSDTSPIRALAHLKLLQVLDELFGGVYLPPAVAAELLHPPDRFESVDVRLLQNCTVREPSNRDRVRGFQAELDAGEAEAIALAEEIHADAILIDEAAGRKVATRVGLAVVGTLGVLVRAKQRGVFAEIRPFLDELRDRLNFYISPALRDEVLRQAGEMDDQQERRQ